MNQHTNLPGKDLNIFDFATGELSQDAFLAWLANWADPIHKATDSALNHVAGKFLGFLTDNKIDPNKIASIKTYLQHHKIDVLIEITLTSSEQKHLILIEDKTGSGHHSDQLNRYREEIATDEKFNTQTLHLIYYKTHDHITYDLHGYRNISRSDALSVFETDIAAKIKNQIFTDYVSRLRRMEDASLAYITLPLAEWRYAQWSGFLMALCEQLGEGANFGHVPNASGGFLGAWYFGVNLRDLNEHEYVYFQIQSYPESDRDWDFTLRISTPDRNATAALRVKIQDKIFGKLQDAKIGYNKKNQRLGQSMRLLSFTDIALSADGDRVEFIKCKINRIKQILET